MPEVISRSVPIGGLLAVRSAHLWGTAYTRSHNGWCAGCSRYPGEPLEFERLLIPSVAFWVYSGHPRGATE